MVKVSEYIRVGTDYYKNIKRPVAGCRKINELVRWKKSEIITDLGKEHIKILKKYDGFTNVPSHNDYRIVIGKTHYNRYQRVEHLFERGEFKNIEIFLRHIFGDQFELGLDYLTILWRNPDQTLPILCLVSKERNTGKTTFLRFLQLIFQGNITINTNDDFRSRFNTDWAYKLLICIDEVLLEKREDSERLKHLSTAKTYKAEAKGVDKLEVPFFGKFILCSNNEDNFIAIEAEEMRYWVIKVHPFASENPKLIATLQKELKHFMYFLNKREIKSPMKTRMWFHPDDIHTEALEKLRKGNQTILMREIRELLQSEFEKFNVEELYYSASDILEKLAEHSVKTITSKVIYCLKKEFGLEPLNSSYKKYHISINPKTSEEEVETRKGFKGRYYTFHRINFL